MPLWYKALHCMGKPDFIINLIGTKIEKDNLSNVVPVMRVEKKPLKSGFYLFLGIESPMLGVMPPEVNGLFPLPFTNVPIPNPFTLVEITSMVGAEMDIHRYTRRIPYVALHQQLDEDPFGQETNAVNSYGDGDGIVARTHRYDRLLLWLSAVGSGSWAQFQSACRALELEDDRMTARRIVRRLRLLGHVETSMDGMRWSIAPSILVQQECNQNEREYTLCGQRDERLLAVLQTISPLRILPQQEGDGPATISIGVDDTDMVVDLLARHATDARVRIVEDAAVRLARVLPPVTEWPDYMQQFPGIVSSLFDVKRFDGQQFVDVAFAHQTGLYELWPMETGGQRAIKPKYTALYDARRDRWLRGDWYGLRFLARYADDEYSRVRYEHATRQLAIPEAWRWPELYERTLVLASGRLPSRQGPWLIYDGIELDMLAMLKTKLGLLCDCDKELNHA